VFLKRQEKIYLLPATAVVFCSVTTASVLVDEFDFFASLLSWLQHFIEPALHDLVEYAQQPAFAFPSSDFTSVAAFPLSAEAEEVCAEAEITNAKNTSENNIESFFIVVKFFI
jgi:hypothetical protein